MGVKGVMVELWGGGYGGCIVGGQEEYCEGFEVTKWFNN